MVEAYWKVGRMIVEEEQQGKERAEYGALLIRNLSEILTAEFGKGFTETNLRYFRQFYLTFPVAEREGIRHTLCDELTWSHYRLLMRVNKQEARTWYMKETADQNWSVRTLERQISSLYYERLNMSRNKKMVVEEMQKKTKHLVPTSDEIEREKALIAKEQKHIGLF